MWTAARHDIGAKFVVCNNRSYQLLKLNVQQYWRERGFAGPRVPGLVRPRRPRDPLRRARARAWACPPTRVETADEVAPGDRRGARRRRPVPDRPDAAPGSARPRRGRGEPPPGRRHEGALVNDEEGGRLERRAHQGRDRRPGRPLVQGARRPRPGRGAARDDDRRGQRHGVAGAPDARPRRVHGLVREGHAPVLRRGAHGQERRVDDRRRQRPT